MANQPNRYMIIDVARGFAIILMIVYHFSWDLTFFRLAEFGIFSDPAWIWFARFIAGLILIVMGISQVMARQHSFNSRIFLKRLVIIASAAALVSAATYQIDPASYVFFGILHHITVASVLLAMAIRLPNLALILLAAIFLSGPIVLVHEVFSSPWLAWSGLGTRAWFSVDYIPLFPWLGLPILGIILGRSIVALDKTRPFLGWQSDSLLIRIAFLAGRHSLAVYMVHQPILFACLYGFVWLSSTIKF